MNNEFPDVPGLSFRERRKHEKEAKEQRIKAAKEGADQLFRQVRKDFTINNKQVISTENDFEAKDLERFAAYKREVVKILVTSPRRDDRRIQEKLAPLLGAAARIARIVVGGGDPVEIPGLEVFSRSTFMIGDQIKSTIQVAKEAQRFQAETLFSDPTIAEEASIYAHSMIGRSDLLRAECEALGISIEDDVDRVNSNLGFVLSDTSEHEQYGKVLDFVQLASVKSGEEIQAEEMLIIASIISNIERNIV